MAENYPIWSGLGGQSEPFVSNRLKRRKKSVHSYNNNNKKHISSFSLILLIHF